MWVVLLDGVGVLCISAGGALRGRAAGRGPYPVLGRRNVAASAQKPPNREAGRGSKKLRLRAAETSIAQPIRLQKSICAAARAPGPVLRLLCEWRREVLRARCKNIDQAPERVPDT